MRRTKRLADGWNRYISSPHLVFASLAGFFGIISAIIVPTGGEGVPDESFHWTFSSAGFMKTWNYPPFWLQSIGTHLAGVFTQNFEIVWVAGRFMNLLGYIVAVYFIIKYLKHFHWVFVFVALTPMMIQQAGSLSYDVYNFIAIFFFLMNIINLSNSKAIISRKQLILLMGSIVVMYFAKVTDLILLLLLFTLPKELFLTLKPIKILREKLGKIATISIAVIILVGICSSLFFIAKNIFLNNPVGWRQTFAAFFNTLFYYDSNGNVDINQTKGIIGAFGMLTFSFPTWIVILAFSILLLVIILESRQVISVRLAILSLVVFVVHFIAFDFGMYFSFGIPVNNIVDFMNGSQGRYFTPLLPLLAPPVVYFVQKLGISVGATHSRMSDSSDLSEEPDAGTRKSLEKHGIGSVIFWSSLFMLTTYIYLTVQYWSAH